MKNSKNDPIKFKQPVQSSVDSKFSNNKLSQNMAPPPAAQSQFVSADQFVQ